MVLSPSYCDFSLIAAGVRGLEMRKTRDINTTAQINRLVVVINGEARTNNSTQHAAQEEGETKIGMRKAPHREDEADRDPPQPRRIRYWRGRRDGVRGR